MESTASKGCEVRRNSAATIGLTLLAVVQLAFVGFSQAPAPPFGFTILSDSSHASIPGWSSAEPRQMTTAPGNARATVPCPGITASSPATLSTTPPPVPLNPCPGIVMSTFLGGSDIDEAWDVATDGDGNIFVVGYTESADFPTTPGAYDTTYNGAWGCSPGYDAFVAKFAPSGFLIFSTFLGGSSCESAEAVAVDALGNAYVTGTTISPDFPTTEGAYDTKGPDGTWESADSFVAKFDPTGDLVYSTLLGGPDGPGGGAIAVDAAGNAYVAGGTNLRFPFPQAVFFGNGGGGDVSVAKLNPEGTDLVYHAVVGGGEPDGAGPIALDAMNNVYVAGTTRSADFPVSPDAFDRTFDPPWPEGSCCPQDGFLFKLSAEATALEFSTFLGGDDYVETSQALAVAPSGNVYVGGFTGSSDFPVTPNAFDPTPDDIFLAEFDPSGALVHGTFLGGRGSSAYSDWMGLRIVTDASGHVYVSGQTHSFSGFPVTPGAYDMTPDGRTTDAFVAKMDPSLSTLVYSTFLGGGDRASLEGTPYPPCPCSGEYARSLSLDPSGNVTLVGVTDAMDFPTTEGAFDTTYNGLVDVFVTRMELIPEPNRSPVAYFEVSSSSEGDGWVLVNATDSADAEDPTELLEIRWDWEDDGVWDTTWARAKETSHQYTVSGTYTIRLELRDTGGLTNQTTRHVDVTVPTTPPSTDAEIQLWMPVAVSAIVTLTAIGLLLVRRKRTGRPPS